MVAQCTSQIIFFGGIWQGEVLDRSLVWQGVIERILPSLFSIALGKVAWVKRCCAVLRKVKGGGLFSLGLLMFESWKKWKGCLLALKECPQSMKWRTSYSGKKVKMGCSQQGPCIRGCRLVVQIRFLGSWCGRIMFSQRFDFYLGSCLGKNSYFGSTSTERFPSC